MGLHIVDLSACAISALLGKLSLVSKHLGLFILTFSSIRFSASGFVLRSLIDLDLSAVQGVKYEPTCILLQTDIGNSNQASERLI